MTQKELAKFVGVSRRTICAIERGKYSPLLEVAFRIANFLCTSIEDVFFYEPDIGSAALSLSRSLADTETRRSRRDLSRPAPRPRRDA